MWKKILSWICNIIFVLICSSSIAITINYCTTGVPSLFGYSLVQVESPSMEASGIIPGDVYLIHQEKTYNIDDIVAYKYDNIVIFHQIINFDEEHGYTLKGSSNYSSDPYYVQLDQIIGSKTTIDIRWLGNPAFRISSIMIIYIIAAGCIAVEMKNIYYEDKNKTINM